MPGLAEPANLPASQAFAGSFYLEPVGWVSYENGHPLKAYRSWFPGSVKRTDLHKGIDSYGAEGIKLLAMEAGTVTDAFTDGTGAKVIRVTIRGHKYVRYQYTHCKSFLVAKGATVARLQPIATLGKTGRYTTGAHNHLELQVYEKGSDGVWRWISYDPARFCPAGTFKYGAPYHGGAYIFGGDKVYSDLIYPIRPVTIGAGVNVRADKSTDAGVLFKTKAVTSARQMNELPGGGYDLDGSGPGPMAYLWAKLKVTTPAGLLVTAYVAKPLIKVA